MYGNFFIHYQFLCKLAVLVNIDAIKLLTHYDPV